MKAAYAASEEKNWGGGSGNLVTFLGTSSSASSSSKLRRAIWSPGPTLTGLTLAVGVGWDACVDLKVQPGPFLASRQINWAFGLRRVWQRALQARVTAKTCWGEPVRMRISDRSSRGRVRKGDPLGADAGSMMASDPSGWRGDRAEVDLPSVVKVDVVMGLASRRGFLDGVGASRSEESLLLVRWGVTGLGTHSSASNAAAFDVLGVVACWSVPVITNFGKFWRPAAFDRLTSWSKMFSDCPSVRRFLAGWSIPASVSLFVPRLILFAWSPCPSGERPPLSAPSEEDGGTVSGATASSSRRRFRDFEESAEEVEEVIFSWLADIEAERPGS